MRFSIECRALALVRGVILLPSSLGINFLKGSFIKKGLMAPVDYRRNMSQQQSALEEREANFIMGSNNVCVASKKEVVVSGVDVSFFSPATRNRMRKCSQVVPGKV